MGIVNQAKEKIQEDYKRKAKQMETQNAIARSTAINKSRLQKIKSRQDVLAQIKEDSKDALIQELKNETKSKDFVKKLMVQGMLMLLEDQVEVRCRACDDKLVESCIPDAMAEYKRVIKAETGAEKECKVSIDRQNKLPPPPSDPHSPSCIGGVVLACQGGTIAIDNTIDSRLKLVLEQAKPNLRKLLFA